MKPSRFLTCLLAGASLVCGVAFADTSSSSSSSQNTSSSGASGGNAALEAALSSCASSVAKDAKGGPDRTAFDACMSAKGFTKPSGPPPGSSQNGGHNGPPPAQSQSK